MTRNTLGKHGLPQSMRHKIAQVGQQIKLARKRRGLTMKEMADRMFVTRKTLYRLETGDPGVSFAILASAMLTLGLENDLDHLANPDSDTTGKLMDKRRHDRKQRIRTSRKVDMDF